MTLGWPGGFWLLVVAVAVGSLAGSVLVAILEWLACIIADRVDARNSRLGDTQEDGGNAAAESANRR